VADEGGDAPGEVAAPVEVVAVENAKPAGPQHVGEMRKGGRLIAVRQMLDMGANPDDVIEWCSTITPAVVSEDGRVIVAAKPWKCSAATARGYIQECRDRAFADDHLDKATKRADNRSTVKRMLRLSIEAGDRSAAAKFLHMLNMIDGSYDEHVHVPTGAMPSKEEAARTIDHAAATLALARARGKAPRQIAPVIIEAEATESDDEEPVPADASSGN